MIRWNEWNQVEQFNPDLDLFQALIESRHAERGLNRCLLRTRLSPRRSILVTVSAGDAAARRLWPAFGHGRLWLLLPHGRRIPVPEGCRVQIPPRAPHPRAGTAPGSWGRLAAAILVQGEGSEQVRHAVRGCGTAGYSGGRIRTKADYGSAASALHKLVINYCCILYDVHHPLRIVLKGYEAKHRSHHKLWTVWCRSSCSWYPAANGGYSDNYQTSAEHVSSQESFMNVNDIVAMCLTIRNDTKLGVKYL